MVGVVILERKDLKKRGVTIALIARNNFDPEKTLRKEGLINFFQITRGEGVIKDL